MKKFLENLREEKFLADNGVKTFCSEGASNFLYQTFNFDFKAARIDEKPPCNFSMILYSRKNQNAATSILAANTGILKFFSRNKNIR